MHPTWLDSAGMPRGGEGGDGGVGGGKEEDTLIGDTL